eukprot:g1168.t1
MLLSLTKLISACIMTTAVLAMQAENSQTQRTLRGSMENLKKDTRHGRSLKYFDLGHFMNLGAEKLKIAKPLDKLPKYVDNIDADSYATPYIDTVVVGGGIGGTYTTYRILSEFQDKNIDFQNIALFERSNRIGGRLYSPKIGKCPRSTKNHPRGELGGMRIRNTDGLMMSLAKELGLELRDFRMQSNPDSGADQPQNPVFMRGTVETRTNIQDVLKNGNRKVQNVNGDGYVPPVPYEFGEFNSSAVDLLDQVFTELQYVNPVIPVPDATLPKGTTYDPCDGKTNAKLLELFLGSNGSMKEYRDHLTDYRVWQLALIAASSIFGQNDESRQFTYATSGYPSFGKLGLSTQDGYAETLIQAAQQQGKTPGGSGVGYGVKYYKRPIDGMQSIPLKLAQEIEAIAFDDQKNIFMNYQLISAERVSHKVCEDWRKFGRDAQYMESIFGHNKTFPTDPPKCYELIFEKTITDPCVEVTKGSGSYKIQFKTSTDSVDSFRLGTQPQEIPGYMNLLDLVQPASLMKIFLDFDTRFWENEGMENKGQYFNFSVGRATTSTVLSNIFAWYPGTQTSPEEKSCLNDGKGGVMQLYVTDPSAIGLFNPYLPQEEEGTLCEAGSCKKCFEGTKMFDASHHVSELFENQIMQAIKDVFGKTEVPKPREIRYQIWDMNSPQTQCAAVNFWIGGVKWWNLYNVYLNLLGKDENVHVVGTTFSYNQGWAEGALETAEHLLQEVYNFERPKWLSKKDYCDSNPFFQPMKR